MDRRVFIGTLAGSLLAAPLAAGAQPAGKVYRIGLLDHSAPDPSRLGWWQGFKSRLRELGYVEGQNVVFEPRWDGGVVPVIPGDCVGDSPDRGVRGTLFDVSPHLVQPGPRQAHLADWQGLLRSAPVQGRQILRKLLVGRLTLTPRTEGTERFYEYAGEATLGRLLGGVIGSRATTMVTPAGHEPFGTITIAGLIRLAA